MRARNTGVLSLHLKVCRSRFRTHLICNYPTVKASVSVSSRLPDCRSKHPPRYTGKRQDPETGLVYMGSRYYDPRLGRFISIDPVEPDENNLHSLNRYAYANNNPYKFTDPDGQAAETVIDVVSLGLSINAYRQDPGFVNGLAVAYDGFATLVPFLPGGIGIIRQAASKGETLTQAVRQAADRGAAKAGEGAQKAAKSESLWSTTKSKSAVENAFGHWSKHKSEFPELQNAKQYAERAKDFLTNPPKGTLTKTNSRGDTLRYDPGTNTFGVLGKDGAPRTMFRPKEGMGYWNRQ
ncbi:MAG: RHS repeat-associated core domain-containing protein [Pseudomonadota bacterium]